MAKLALYYPLKPFFISQNFGENLVPVYKTWGLLGHPGIDMVGSTGQVLRAACEGVVTYVGFDENEGLGVVIRTQEQYDYVVRRFNNNEWEIGGKANMKHIYWHLLPDSIKVKVGDIIKPGDFIGLCDSTGVVMGVKYPPSIASHLHFAIKPTLQGEFEWVWYNVSQTNGYHGNIDPDPYWNGLYAVDIIQDPVPPQDPTPVPEPEDPVVIENLKQQISLLQKVVNLLKKLLGYD